MNCQDIARILESRDVNELSVAERNACETHAATCRQCGPEWITYTRLAAIAVPPMAPEFAARCEALVASQRSVTRFRRVSARAIVVSGVLVICAAAAAMLATHLLEAPPAADGPQTSPVAVPAQSSLIGPPAPIAAESAKRERRTGSLEPAVKPFTVRVLPLQDNAKNALGNGTVAAMYADFLEHLRAVPGATLLEPDLPGAVPSIHVDVEITMTHEDMSDNRVGGQLQATSFQPEGAVRGRTFFPYTITGDPDGTAAVLVTRLRKFVFPPDPALRRQALARLLDRSLSAQERLRALTDLGTIGLFNGTPTLKTTQEMLRDPIVVRAAVDLATASSDPTVRAAVWNTLRDTESTELVPPLLTALGLDPDDGVRLAAIGVLSNQFRKDERVLAAFSTAAEHDPWPLMRALARRYAGGPNAESAWNNYVVDSLKDPGRTAMERIEALFYQMNLPVAASISYASTLNTQLTFATLDDDAIKALIEALPLAAADSPVVQQSTSRLVIELAHNGRPAATDVLLALLKADSLSQVRADIVESLGTLASRRNDPRVHAVLERLSTGDPDQHVREIASKALGSNAAPPTYDVPAGPRLGVTIRAVESGSNVDKELVGKAFIMDVMPGSAAEKAGVLQGDVLLEINGTPIPSDLNVPKMLDSLPRGADIGVLVFRGGKTLNLTVRF